MLQNFKDSAGVMFLNKPSKGPKLHRRSVVALYKLVLEIVALDKAL
jgi:hypothetical protein